VAGVVALVLAANPGLRWDEVRDLLRDSADRIDDNATEYDGNGHSNRYGYGRVNAAAAVRLASAKRDASERALSVSVAHN
jgi:subtilisin family serine protease